NAASRAGRNSAWRAAAPQPAPWPAAAGGADQYRDGAAAGGGWTEPDHSALAQWSTRWPAAAVYALRDGPGPVPDRGANRGGPDPRRPRTAGRRDRGGAAGGRRTRAASGLGAGS